jgi:hypothetical protein
LGEHPTQQQALLGVKLKTGLSPVQVRPSAPQFCFRHEPAAHFHYFFGSLSYSTSQKIKAYRKTRNILKKKGLLL